MKLLYAVIGIFVTFTMNNTSFAQDELIEADASADTAVDQDNTGPAGTDDPFGTDSELPPEEEIATSSAIVMDNEVVDDPKDKPATTKANFIGLLAPHKWTDRNGLGATVGMGGITCLREYCDSSIDTKMFGSALGIAGAYYRFTPNLSAFFDFSFAYLNTNLEGNPQVAGVDKEGAFLFASVAGARFHVPVKGWLDIYSGLGTGFIMMNVKAETGSQVFYNKWRGIDFQFQLGANFYFFSEKPVENLSIGPFIRFDFPIWPKLVRQADGITTEGRPSEFDDQNLWYYRESPFIYQMGVEARWDFGLTFF